MEGWIKLHRSLLESDFWKCETFSRGQAWVDLLMLANFKDSFFYKRGVKIDVKRGQLGRSEVELSDRWKWSRSKVRKFLKDLEKEQQIKVVKSSVTQVITIIKYNDFQSEEQQKDIKRTAKEQQKDSKKTHIKKGNNDKKEKNEEEDIINDIYSLYPTNCPVKGNSNDKGKANKEQIKRILKSKEENVDSLKAKIERYVRECKSSNTFLKNFKTFLNNLPDYSEEEKKDELKEVNPYLWIKKQLEEEPKKTFNSSYINSLRHKEMKLSDEEFKELSKMNNLKAERLRFAK